MSIVLPGASKLAFKRFFGRKPPKGPATAPEKPLTGQEVAKLFNKKQQAAAVIADAPAKLNDAEKKDRDRLSSLRSAIYSKD
ncbi:MAG: hypothetical protein IKD58_14140 [Loktanella sp.]|nr:hypothetical protein [Loktanella sp.]